MKAGRVILDICLRKDFAEHWKAPPQARRRHKHIRIHKRVVRAENLAITIYVVVGDEAASSS